MSLAKFDRSGKFAAKAPARGETSHDHSGARYGTLGVGDFATGFVAAESGLGVESTKPATVEVVPLGSNGSAATMVVARQRRAGRKRTAPR